MKSKILCFRTPSRFAIEAAFKQLNQKSNKAKFKLVNSLGAKTFVKNAITTSKYSAILSHSSASYNSLFPSLRELKRNGFAAEHMTKSELQSLATKGFSKGLNIAACNAGYWADGNLSAESKSSTEIAQLLKKAFKWLYDKSLTE